MKKKVIFFIKLLFISATLLVIYHVLFVTETFWSGVYYPKGKSYGSAIYSPRFPNKEECIGWAINERGLRPEDTDISLADLWECNKNCVLDSSYGNLLHATQEYKQKLLDNNRGSLYSCEDGGFDGGDWYRGDF